MRVLKDAEEVALTEAFAVAPKELSRSGANLACASRAALANRATNEVKSIFAGESKTTRTDRVAVR
jgi:hypothetical protein